MFAVLGDALVGLAVIPILCGFYVREFRNDDSLNRITFKDFELSIGYEQFGSRPRNSDPFLEIRPAKRGQDQGSAILECGDMSPLFGRGPRHIPKRGRVRALQNGGAVMREVVARGLR